MSKPDISNLNACIEEAKQAALDQDPGPDDILQFHTLLGRLHAARHKVPPLYRDAVLTPFLAKLNELGEEGFNETLVSDPDREGPAGLLLDISRTLLQRGEGFQAKAAAAFQEVVSDLYDGFLSVEDRKGIHAPDLETLPPLVEFGRPSFGPYTWPADATSTFGLKAAVVSLPPSNGRRGLLAWPALAHETAGHDVLHADKGLLAELADAVQRGLAADPDTKGLAQYWSSRIDETASDVLGILNMGPAPGIGLVGYFRAFSASFGLPPVLRSVGAAGDPHPVDLLRGYLAAETVRQLEFSDAASWANVIDAETNKDAPSSKTVQLDGLNISLPVAKKSAEIVARVIVGQPLKALENHAFGEIQNWRDTDEAIVERLRGSLTTANALPVDLVKGAFAAHLVAAATTAALTQGANVPALFGRLLDLLKAMNERNPSFGALKVRHPSNITRDRFYVPIEVPSSNGYAPTPQRQVQLS